MNLDQFMVSRQRVAWIDVPHALDVYVRKSCRVHPFSRKLCYSLDVANLANRQGEYVGEFWHNVQRLMGYRCWLRNLELWANQSLAEFVYIENVLNEGLTALYYHWGYIEYPNDSTALSLYKLI